MFGSRIKELREKHNMSQPDIARLLRVSPVTISRYEAEQREPDIDVLIWYSQYFNVSVDWLVGLSDNPIKKDLTPEQREALEKTAAEAEAFKITDEELAALLPANIREGILALLRLERDKWGNN